MVDAPVTCKLLSHSLSCQPPRINPKKKQSPAGPKWASDKDISFCQSCGFQFNVIIRRHHCRLCGGLFCRYCAQDCWPLPKFEYLHPVRVCRKCSRSCWKAEALLQAITNNDINSLAKYVQRKNDCNLHTSIYPPLIVAAAAGFSEVCRILISGGAKVNFQVPAYQHTVLVTCAFCHHPDAHTSRRGNAYECQRCHEVTYTLSDADRDAAYKGLAPSDHVGLTALHAAVKGLGHVDVVRALLSLGADVDLRTHNGNTALHLASAYGHTDCVRMLVRRRADVNAVCDFDGDTPLHRAVREGHAEICKFLITHGAGKLALRQVHKNLEGLSAEQLAQRKKKPDVVAALESPVCPQEPSHGPDKAPSPMPESDAEEGAALHTAASRGDASAHIVTPNRAAGDALEEDLELQAREALALEFD